MNIRQDMFSIGKNGIFKPTGNFPHIKEFLTFGKALLIPLRLHLQNVNNVHINSKRALFNGSEVLKP